MIWGHPFMRILYAAMYNDPTDLTASSGVDYNFYVQIKKYADEVKVLGPFRIEGMLPERIFKRLYTQITGKRYMKWNLRAINTAARQVNQTVRTWHPDVVFSMFPSNLAFYKGDAPAVFATDLAFQTWQEHGAGFGHLPFRFQVWLEKQTIAKSNRVIVSSYQLKDELTAYHNLNADKFHVIPMPSALPDEVVPQSIDIQRDKKLESPLRLLLVGREFHRKGVDIAIEIVQLLNRQGLPAELTICATEGPELPHVRYAGSFRKNKPSELKQYADLYRQAHLLIHPARFDPSPIVTAEAAAFGTPTITNNVGGIATSVKNDTSGIVLPKHSPPEAYVQAIKGLVDNPERYYALCRSTRRRYESELNWNEAGKRVAAILKQAACEKPQFRP